MDELIAFLNARLDEDEAVAKAATPGEWDVNDEEFAEAIYTVDPDSDIAVVAGGRWGGEATVFNQTADALHIARHDPARVLADVAAKRAIVEMHYIIERKVTWVDADGDDWQNHQPVCVVCVEKYSSVEVPADLGPCPTVRLLASVYADHPDYREEWRP